MKRQPLEWKRVFANCVSDKGLICNLYVMNNSVTASTAHLINYWAEDRIDVFQGRLPMASRYVKRPGTRLVTGEIKQNHSEIPAHTCQNN